MLLDAREPADFAAGHLRGAVNVGLQGRFAEWAGDVLSPERDIVLVGDPTVALEAKVRLGRVGYDRVVGQLDDPGEVFATRPELIETSSRLTIEQLAELRGLEPALQLVDVRGPGETAGGTLPGAREIPLAVLTDSLAGLDRANPVVVYCASGYRSRWPPASCAHAGFADVSDLLGGYAAWEGAGLPTSTRRAAGHARHDAPGQRPGRPRRWSTRAPCSSTCGSPTNGRRSTPPRPSLMPMGQVRERQGELPGDRRIVVVCRSGGRSAAVTESLRAWGFDAVNLAGGMCAWAAAGLPVVRGRNDPAPVAGSRPDDADLVVHRVHPLNCETSIAALIGGVVMPNARFYVRNHFETPSLDPATWRLEVGGLVERPLRLSLRDIRDMPSHTLVATLECAGNGRSLFGPPVEGEQWQLGAVSTAEWTGVPLVEVLDRAGTIPGGCEVVFRGADRGTVEGSTEPICFERSLSLDDARGSEALLAYAMNGEPLPVQHGYPLRVIVPGWYAVTSVKWLTDIEVIDHAFEASSRPSATLRVGAGRDDRPGAGPPPAGPIADHRAAAERGRRRRRPRHPRCRMVRRSADRTRRRERRRRPVAAGPHGRRTPPSQLAVVGAAHPHRRERPHNRAGPSDRPRRPHPARAAPSGTDSATAATPSRLSTYGSVDVDSAPPLLVLAIRAPRRREPLGRSSMEPCSKAGGPEQGARRRPAEEHRNP